MNNTISNAPYHCALFYRVYQISFGTKKKFEKCETLTFVCHHKIWVEFILFCWEGQNRYLFSLSVYRKIKTNCIICNHCRTRQWKIVENLQLIIIISNIQTNSDLPLSWDNPIWFKCYPKKKSCVTTTAWIDICRYNSEKGARISMNR